MLFGTIFTGQVKTQEKQYIETKVFCFIIPLTIVTTYLVTKATANGVQGLEIKNNRTSIIALSIRPITFILIVFAIGAFIGNYDTMLWLIAPAIASIVLFIYFNFYFGRTTKYERFVRAQFGKQFGLYFMPNWLKPEDLKAKFEMLKNAYITHFGTTDWKEKLKNTPYNKGEFSLLYCLTALENTIDNNPDTEKMLKEISTYEIKQKIQ